MASASTTPLRRASAACLSGTDSGSASCTKPHPLQRVEADALLDASQHGRRLRLVDHRSSTMRPTSRDDLATGVGQRARGLRGRRALLDVDEAHGAAAQREGQRDLAADPAGPEDGDRGGAPSRGGSLP